MAVFAVHRVVALRKLRIDRLSLVARLSDDRSSSLSGEILLLADVIRELIAVRRGSCLLFRARAGVCRSAI